MALVNDLSLSPQEDCEAENVWEMGGLGILTSVPITPRVVCFLCASSGHVEVRSPASWYARQCERLFCCDETNHYILFRWFIAGTIPCLNQQLKCFCFLEISGRSLLFIRVAVIECESFNSFIYYNRVLIFLLGIQTNDKCFSKKRIAVGSHFIVLNSKTTLSVKSSPQLIRKRNNTSFKKIV